MFISFFPISKPNRHYGTYMTHAIIDDLEIVVPYYFSYQKNVRNINRMRNIIANMVAS